jgi:hypothetical protein
MPIFIISLSQNLFLKKPKSKPIMMATIATRLVKKLKPQKRRGFVHR